MQKINDKIVEASEAELYDEISDLRVQLVKAEADVVRLEQELKSLIPEGEWE